MNDEEFGSFKFFKLKYKSGDQIIPLLCRIGSPKKLGSPSLIWGNYKKIRKILVNHVKYIEI